MSQAGLATTSLTHEKAEIKMNVSATMSANVKSSITNTVKKVMGDDDLSWEELKEIEARRRAIFKRKDLKFYQILTYWDGTVLKVLALDPLMWFTMLVYVGVRIQARVGLPDFVSDIAAGDIGVIGAFLSFFLVFFVVNSNNRFNKLYAYSMSCEGRIFNVATICRASMPKANSLRLIRYMNAAHIAGYVGLSSTYTYNNFFIEMNRNNVFLTREEVKRMCEIDMDVGGSCYRELIAWCILEVEMALEEELIPLRSAIQLRDIILRLRGMIGSLYDYGDLPIPFFYVHFICLLSALYLPLFAVSAAFEAGTGDDVYWTADVVAGLVVFLQAVFVIGLRILGQKMMDPYGDDVEDLSVMHYVNFTWRMSNRILLSKKPPKLNAQQEDDICVARAPLGEAWEDTFKVSIVDTDPAYSYDIEPPVEEDSGGRCTVQ